MKTVIINGSPKGSKGNTEIFISHFMKGFKNGAVVRRIVEEDIDTLAKELREYESIILALPLYIHSMPGLVMRLIEKLEPSNCSSPRFIGFILQCGFPEGSQCAYLERYFESLSEQLNRVYLGTFIKPESAGVQVMPAFLTKKLFENLEKLAAIYEESCIFDKEIINKMMQPYDIKGFTLTLLKVARWLGLTNIMWNRSLKEEKGFKNRFARPFLS